MILRLVSRLHASSRAPVGLADSWRSSWRPSRVREAGGIAASLERKSLLTRVRSAADGRARTLLATPEGRLLAERGVAFVESADHDFFGARRDRPRFLAGLRALDSGP